MGSRCPVQVLRRPFTVGDLVELAKEVLECSRDDTVAERNVV